MYLYILDNFHTFFYRPTYGTFTFSKTDARLLDFFGRGFDKYFIIRGKRLIKKVNMFMEKVLVLFFGRGNATV